MEDPLRGLRLAAPCREGSAAHPVSPGPHQQRRRASAVHRPAHATIGPSDQREWPKQRTCALKGGGCRCGGQAGGKPGPVGFHRLRMKSCPSIQCARGAFLVKRRARRSAPERCAGPSASSAPLIRSRGVAGNLPRRWGSERRKAARAQGKPFPSRESFIAREMIQRYYQIISMRNGGSWCTRLDSNQWPTPSEGVTLSS